MILRVKSSSKFDQMYRDLLKLDSEIKILVDKKIILFKHKPEDARLKNHRLTGKMSGQWAFSITDDIRIVYKIIGKNTVRFLAIGPHQKVYSKD